MKEKILKRLERELGENFSEVLSEKLSGADLHSLLLSVIKQRNEKMPLSELLKSSAATKICNIDGRLINTIEAITYDTANDFEAVELSPVATIGAVSKLTGLDQANVLSTIRAFECAADPTIMLGIEAAKRRKESGERRKTLNLCSNHRVLRFPLPKNPAYTAHFKLFSMISAGRDSGSFTFELSTLQEQIAVYMRLFESLQKNDGLKISFEDIVVELSDTRIVSQLCASHNIDRNEVRALVRARDGESSARLLANYPKIWTKEPSCGEELATELPQHLCIQLDLLKSKVMDNLAASFPQVRFGFNLHRLTGLGYYDGPCFHIKANNKHGQSFMLADGGFTDWTKRLLSDGKERLLTSAVGTELLIRMFRD